MAENTFILNRYLMRQFETDQPGGNCRSTAAASQQHQADYDFNANEFTHLNSELFYGQSKLLKKSTHKSQVYYDMPLCLSSCASNDTTSNQPLNFIRKTDITESPSRSSFAKLPNCLRRKQLAIHKSKHVENQLDTKLTGVYKNGRSIEKDYQSSFPTQRESVIDQSSYRPNLIDPNSLHNECCQNGGLTVSAPLESTPSPKRLYDRLKRNHIRHIVKTTREKINQSLSSFKRSGKSRNHCSGEETSKRGIFFSNSYSDPHLHLSVQQMIEEKSSQNFEHFIMSCDGTTKQRPLSKLSRFSSVDNLFDDDEFKNFEVANYENELNHAKKSFFKTNILQRQRPLSSSRDDRLKWWQKPKINTKSSSTSSSSKSKENSSEGEYIIGHSGLSPAHTNTAADNGVEEVPAQFERADNGSFCTPQNVPDWNELCNRIYRFRIKPSNQTLPWNSSESSFKSIPPSLLLQAEKPSNSLNSTVETITQSCRQELFSQTSPSLINSTSSQPKCDAPTGSLLLPDSTAAPVEPKIQFDVKVFIDRVAKHIFALKETSPDRESLEKAIENIDLSQFEADGGDEDAVELFHLNQQPSVKAYKTFLLDLCKEQSKGTFCIDASCPVPHFSLMLPHRCKKRPWPLTEDLFVQALRERIESLLELKTDAKQSPSTTRSAQHFTDQRKCAQEVRRFGLMAYCRKQRKMDLVDSVLYQEMIEDEHQWSLQFT